MEFTSMNKDFEFFQRICEGGLYSP